MSKVPKRTRMGQKHVKFWGYTRLTVGVMVAAFMLFWCIIFSVIAIASVIGCQFGLATIAGGLAVLSALICRRGLKITEQGIEQADAFKANEGLHYAKSIRSSDLLLRSSQEPTIAQSEVLLRAATEQGTAKAELLRGIDE